MADDPSPPPAPGGRVEPRLTNDYGEIVDHWKREAAGHKSRVTAVERERDEARAAVEAAKAETTAAVAAVEAKARERLIRAELKAVAVKAGITDPRDLALLDVSKAKLGDDGELQDGAALIEAFRTERPHLFGKSGNSSSTAPAPSPSPPATKLARDMTADEWRVARAAALKAA